ncbi:PKD domain-containing protein [Methanofollis aquaemaris]|uniref:PKD domain-containing protein n=2 Tax=Methanofollis aquaemaris TaxID=126734 RepID=A0A8A3S8I6_9EURY|nr:PKD domain-containing protein [Methanofollis aquaemaris]
MLAHLDNDALADGRIMLYHDGGDPLEKGHFQILLDGRDRTADFTTFDGSGDWNAWRNGDVLLLDLEGGEVPADIRITADGVRENGSTWLLHILRDSTSAGPTVTPTPVRAAFTADPAAGATPLTVRFTDLSTGSPTSWSWDFGDGETSTEQHPAHTYDTPGTCTVTLTARNSAGSDTTSRTITVTAPPAETLDITLITAPPKGGTLNDRSSLAFTVTGSWSYIQVGGKYLALSPGDRVEFTLIGDQKGKLFATGYTITSFEFPDVQVTVNDEIVGEGAIGFGEIWISRYDNPVSTLTLSIEPETAWTSLLVDGRVILEDWDDGHGIVLSTLMPDSMGVMNLDLTGIGQIQKQVFYQGGAERYALV